MELTDGSVTVETVFTVSRCVKILTSMIPIGFGLGCIPMIFGLGISGIVKIFKSI